MKRSATLFVASLALVISGAGVASGASIDAKLLRDVGWAGPIKGDVAWAAPAAADVGWASPSPVSVR